jgi:hypothetical protein
VFTRFIDDAAVFPPGLAPLPAAVANHLKNADLPAAGYIGPLVLPLADIAEAARLATDPGTEPAGTARQLDLSAVVPVGRLAEAGDLPGVLPPHATLTGVELKVSDDTVDDTVAAAAVFRTRHPDIAVWIELPTGLVDAPRLTRMRDHDLGLKFRTGGVTRDLYPTGEELLGVLGTAVETGIRFKLTAGLHRALRYSETVGDERLDHFGFLNIAACVSVLRRGGTAGAAAAILASDDGEEVLAAAGVDGADGGWRENFTSFGCCSVLEALTTLSDLGAVDRGVLENMTEPTT